MPDGTCYNSVVSLGASPTQVYRKSHLVPFGVHSAAAGAGLDRAVLAIPLQDFSRGSADQQPLKVGGQHVAADICYEMRSRKKSSANCRRRHCSSMSATSPGSAARSLHSNTCRSRRRERSRREPAMRHQHRHYGRHQPARPGRVAAPEFTTAVVTREVRGFRGATPFVRWGNCHAVLALCAALVGIAFATRAAGSNARSTIHRVRHPPGPVKFEG